jgi:hypothetical protein
VYGNIGAVRNRTGYNSDIAGGGGAGSAGNLANGGSGITRFITGTAIIYAAGGGSNVPEANAPANTGNGGRQAGVGPALIATSFAGGSGVVIVRFPR